MTCTWGLMPTQKDIINGFILQFRTKGTLENLNSTSKTSQKLLLYIHKACAYAFFQKKIYFLGKSKTHRGGREEEKILNTDCQEWVNWIQSLEGGMIWIWIFRKIYYYLSFEHDFTHLNDTVYFAYCVPYTFSTLTKLLKSISSD
jgi:hypothetical protein